MGGRQATGRLRAAKRTADRILAAVFGPRWLQFRARRAWDRHARTRSLEATASHDAADADGYWKSGQRDWSLLQATCARAGLQDRQLAIEIGCGLGRLTRVAAADYGQVVGLDVSPQMIKQARQSSTEPNIVYQLVGADGEMPIQSGTADLVFAWTVFRHMSKPMFERYLDESWRVLKPEGGLAFEALIRDQGRMADPTLSDPDTEREYSTQELEGYAAQHGYLWAADEVIPSLTAGTHNLVVAWRKRPDASRSPAVAT